jgi:biotin carboxylase
MLWIVGKSLQEFRDYFAGAGMPFGLFWDKTLPAPTGTGLPIVPLEYNDVDTLAGQLAEIGPLEVTAIIVAGYENYVLAAAYIAQYFKVPGPSIEAAMAATDKAIMRQNFIDYDPALSPDFAEVADWDEALEFMESHSFPVMLKPASLMKSLLITKSNTVEALEKNYRRTTAEIQRLYGKYNIGRQPKIIIEEYLDGSMHTVAAFAGHDGEPIIIPGITDCVTAQEFGHNDNYLYSRTLPTALSQEDQNSIMRAAEGGMRALRMANCPAHIEIMLTKSGPKIIEIGARIGGYRPRMYEYAYGIDMQRVMIDIASGAQPSISQQYGRSTTVFELFPDGEGQFSHVTYQYEIEKLPSLRHCSIKAKPGETIGRSSQGYKAAVVIILGSEDAEQCAQDAAYIRKNVTVELAG